ncbi:MAG: flavodoxin domain-containing protein [Nitrososphaerales archaeon]|jgi:flavodoxin
MGTRACIAYDTLYGNTEKVARALEAGLQEAGVETVCANAREVAIDSLDRYDLICVGGPTEWLTASDPVKEFLGRLRGADLGGKPCFAFDTRLDRWLSGSASRAIERQLGRMGLRILRPRRSARVFLVNGRRGGAALKEGEEERFRSIGRELGTALLGGEGVKDQPPRARVG